MDGSEAERGTALRIGVLGAARINGKALLEPAQDHPEVAVHAIAARSAERAREQAHEYGVPAVYGDYHELLADPDVDVVYVPLPNGLHGHWTRHALAAGKHVLCEKPFTANSEEAKQLAEIAAGSDRVIMEAVHYRYHPLALRAREIVDSGELGTVRRIDAAICFPLYRRSDIRFDPDLAGGATMDAGCYAIHLARLLGRSDVAGEPKVVSAKAKLRGRAIDRAMSARLEFPGGHGARIRCSIWSPELMRSSARVIGELGELRVFNPIAPHTFGRLSVRVGARRRVEHFPRRPTYSYQLDALADAVLRGAEPLTGTADSIATMTVIDEVYRAAGLSPREPSR